MPDDQDSQSAVRLLSGTPARPRPSQAPLFGHDAPRRSRRVTTLVITITAIAALGVLGYQAFRTPARDASRWTPPAGLSAEQTPDWLRTLCADQTPELCAAAERARTATECEAMRAALQALQATQRKLSARDQLSSRQYFVLLELYAQGGELCQFKPIAL